MEGTVKSCVPELVVEELVACGELDACGELVVCAEAVAVTVGSAAAECVCVAEAVGVGDDSGVAVSADVGESPGVPANAPADPPVAAADEAAEGFDPAAPHALRPTPPMTTAMITAGTRHILMPQPSDE
jgi:hypothetical protein